MMRNLRIYVQITYRSTSERWIYRSLLRSAGNTTLLSFITDLYHAALHDERDVGVEEGRLVESEVERKVIVSRVNTE